MATSAGLEEAKNRALLFFMDHLMSKTGERTIHDLSCQFGARGFSAEMREAVGSTQEGLQDFLAAYPSLFKLDGDSISVNAFGDMGLGEGDAPLLANLGARDRDYVQESIVFFEGKLRKFGPEMLIKSLLGHRSQAAPEVRVVSGRHVKDFTNFLEGHPDHFIVEGERVRMTQMPEPSSGDGELDDDGLPLAGAKAKAAAVDFMREVLENQELPMPMDSLYGQFCDRFTHAVRQDVATNPKELLSFLKLNRNIFFIRSNKVSLVRLREGEEGAADSDASGASSQGGVSENVLDQTSVIASLRSATEAVTEIANSNAPPIVAIDFKTVALGGPEFLSLVVVRAPSGRLLVFDVAHSDSILLESGLKDLLQSPDWLKVIHDAKRVSGILSQQYGVQLQGIFDTQVGNWILQSQKTGKAVEEMRGTSFVQLQRLYAPESLMASDLNPRRTPRPDATFWSTRPLPPDALRLAVEEIRVLVPAIYNLMCSQLRPEMQELFNRLCAVQMSVPGGAVAPRPAPPLPNGRSASFSNSVKAEEPRNGAAPCQCRCGAKAVSVSTQTLSTGDITIQGIYKDA